MARVKRGSESGVLAPCKVGQGAYATNGIPDCLCRLRATLMRDTSPCCLVILGYRRLVLCRLIGFGLTFVC